MIKNVTYNDNGNIEIDNDELLAGRADISLSDRNSDLIDNNAIGGTQGKEEENLKQDLKRSGWHEAKKATDIKHKCPVCGTVYFGRPNKTYCTDSCKNVAKMRRSRKRKRDIKNFKPYRGTMGEVYFLAKEGDKSVIAFIPAINAENRDKAKAYIKDNYRELKNSPNSIKSYIAQVNMVIKK